MTRSRLQQARRLLPSSTPPRGELRTVRLVGSESDFIIDSTQALHAGRHDVYAVQDCELVRLGPDVPWGSGQFDAQKLCLDETEDGTILSTYYWSDPEDPEAGQLAEDRHASWIVESGVLVETELIERTLYQPYTECIR